jgi:hypothetical protein
MVEFFEDGSAYAGGVDADGLRSGAGVLFEGGHGMPSRVYDGQWVGGHRHGLGVELTPSSNFAGCFARGRRMKGKVFMRRTYPMGSGSGSTVASPSERAFRGPEDWTRDEVCEFVRELCLPDLAEQLRAEEATGADLVAYAVGPEVSRRVLGRVLRTLSSKAQPVFCKPDIDMHDILYGSTGTCGGNGIVHFAQLAGEGVAVKVARSGSGSDIMKEACILNALQEHPNVVQYKGFANDADTGPCLVLALAELTLYEAVHRGSVELENSEIVEIGVGIAAGLAHLHDAGVVHLDIKSPNILLTNMVPQICDFGHAAFRSEGEASPHNVLGTPVTASPEVVLEGPVSFSADVWSLGVVLLEMFTAELPFDGLTYSQVIVAVAYCSEPLSTDFAAPRHFKELVRACLQRDPHDRPTAREMEAGLREVNGKAQTQALAALEAFHMPQVEEPLQSHYGDAHPEESCFAGIARFFRTLWD